MLTRFLIIVAAIFILLSLLRSASYKIQKKITKHRRQFFTEQKLAKCSKCKIYVPIEEIEGAESVCVSCKEAT